MTSQQSNPENKNPLSRARPLSLQPPRALKLFTSPDVRAITGGALHTVASPECFPTPPHHMEQLFAKDALQVEPPEYQDDNVADEFPAYATSLKMQNQCLDVALDNTSKRQALLAANQNGTLTGMVSISTKLRHNPDFNCFSLVIGLERIYTRAKHRGKGISSALLEGVRLLVQDDVRHLLKQRPHASVQLHAESLVVSKSGKKAFARFERILQEIEQELKGSTLHC